MFYEKIRAHAPVAPALRPTLLQTYLAKLTGETKHLPVKSKLNHKLKKKLNFKF